MRASAGLLAVSLGVSMPAMADAQCVPLELDLWEPACFTTNDVRTDGTFGPTTGIDPLGSESRPEAGLHLDGAVEMATPVPEAALVEGSVAATSQATCAPLEVNYWDETCFETVPFARWLPGLDPSLPLDAPGAVFAATPEDRSARGKAPDDPVPGHEPRGSLGPPPVEGLRLDNEARSHEARERIQPSSQARYGSSRPTAPRPDSG